MTTTDPTRQTDDIEPFVPRMPETLRPDGGTPRPRRPARVRPERPPRTDYADECCRHTEEIEPLVPDLR